MSGSIAGLAVTVPLIRCVFPQPVLVLPILVRTGAIARIGRFSEVVRIREISGGGGIGRISQIGGGGGIGRISQI